MSVTKTTQQGNTANGDIVARDKTEHHHAEVTPTHMSVLIRKFKEEADTDTKAEVMIEKLRHYSVNVDDGSVIGLKAKLEEAGLAHLHDRAARNKEAYFKKLMKHTFSEAAQTIHAAALAKTHARFEAYVTPKLAAGASDEEVLAQLHEKVVEPVETLLEDNILDLYTDEVNGMVYFLTGNCHLRWV